MKRAFLTLLAAFGLASPVFGQLQTWNIDPNHTASQFAVRHLGISTVRGSFEKTTGTVKYDPKNLSATVIEATIDAASVNTRVSARDNDLRSPSYLDVQRFPTITFRSKRVEPNGEGRLKAIGDLTIKGVAKEVVLDIEGPSAPMSDPRGNAHMGASATTRIQRTDFGVGKPGPMVGEDVQITLDIELVSPAAPSK